MGSVHILRSWDQGSPAPLPGHSRIAEVRLNPGPTGSRLPGDVVTGGPFFLLTTGDGLHWRAN